MVSRTSTSLLDMDCKNAKAFFLKQESFFNANLPRYFDFAESIKAAEGLLSKSSLTELSKARNALSQSEDVNHKILANKDGNYAWRPLQILHPVVYVDLVNEITEEGNWIRIKKDSRKCNLIR